MGICCQPHYLSFGCPVLYFSVVLFTLIVAVKKLSPRCTASFGTSLCEACHGTHHSLLILKEDRTGSTWLALELNRLKGVHVTQETFLHWERDWNYSLGDIADAPDNRNLALQKFMNVESRTRWLQESLLRPMPKNPFSHLACLSPRKRWFEDKIDECNNLQHILEISESTEKQSPHQSQKSLYVCMPPFSSDDPSCGDDTRSCFNQLSSQPKCFRRLPECMKIIGMSTGFRSEMLHIDGSKLSLEELSDVYKGVKLAFRGSLSIVGQTRMNFVRHSLSKFFRRNDANHVELTIEDLLKTTQRSIDLLNMVHTIDGQARIVTYEEMGKDIGLVLSKITGLGERNSTVAWSRSTNTQEKNDTQLSVKNKISNFDSLKKVLQDYPCFHSQLLSSNKYARWTLPGVFDKKLGTFIFEPRQPCCELRDDIDMVRSIQDVFSWTAQECRE